MNKTRVKVPNGENFTDSNSRLNSRRTQTLGKPGNTAVKRVYRGIGDPTALINVAASVGRYDGSEIGVLIQCADQTKE
jgi:hypothetical protein